MGEVVRLVSGAELGIHADWQAVGGRKAGEATPGRLCFRPSKATLWSRGLGGQQASLGGNPVFSCEPADRALPTPLAPSPLHRRPAAGQYLEERLLSLGNLGFDLSLNEIRGRRKSPLCHQPSE